MLIGLQYTVVIYEMNSSIRIEFDVAFYFEKFIYKWYFPNNVSKIEETPIIKDRLKSSKI